MNKKKVIYYFDSTATLLQGIALLLLGTVILNSTDIFLNIVAYGLALGFVIIGVTLIINNIIGKRKKIIYMNFVYAIVNILIGTLIFYKPHIFIAVFPFLFTWYFLLDFVIRLINFLIYKNNNIGGRFLILIRGIVSIIFFFIMLFFPMFRETVTYTLVGIYFIVLSLTFIFDAIESMIPILKMNKIKRKFRIVLPIFITAFLPIKVLNEINEIFVPYKRRKDVEILKENITPDLEVIISMGKGFSENFGHVDIFFEGVTYSYGSYDESRAIFSSSIGDGVLCEVDKDKYIDFLNNNHKKTVISYGVRLNQKQKEEVAKKIQLIKKDTFRWYPRSSKDNSRVYKDYASKVYNHTNAIFLKFFQGKFKTYFLLQANCVFLADQLIGASGIDIIKLSGIMAPGTYCNYFEREFKRKNSNVVSKDIYIENKIK